MWNVQQGERYDIWTSVCCFMVFEELVARLSKMKVLCLCLARWGEMSSLTSWGGQKTGQWCFVVVKTKTWYKYCWIWADKTQLPSKTSHNLDCIMFIFFFSMHIDLLWSSRFYWESLKGYHSTWVIEFSVLEFRFASAEQYAGCHWWSKSSIFWWCQWWN